MNPDGPALRFMGQTTTWRELHRRVCVLANGLSRRGVGTGHRVIIEMLNCTEFIESLLAINLLGAIAVPVNFRLSPPEIALLVADCQARVAITEPALSEILTAVRELQPSLERIIITGDTARSGTECYEDVLAEQGEPHAPADIPNDSTALIIYTSGTTGRSKGAMLTHVNLMSQAMNMLMINGVDLDNDVNFIGVPLFHIAGIGNVLNGLLLGIPTVIYPSGAFDAEELLDVIAAEKVSSLFLVPAQWQALCAAQHANPRSTWLRVLSWGAAPASKALLRQIAEAFPGTQILAAFGQTEMSPVTCALTATDASRKIGSVGKIIPTIAARVVNDDMTDVPIGDVGEIVYRGPTLMEGYWNDPEATAEAFAGGWFHSGDLVRQDNEGYVWVVDRKKDMIISGGENIYCPEVEHVLETHPAITEVAVIGRVDDKWGEVPIAVAAISEGTLALSDLRELMDQRLARYKHPKALAIVDALPRNAAGKVLKRELRARFGTASSPDAARLSAP